MSRKWLYTSVTRATELKNVYFDDPKVATAEYDEVVLDKYLAKKVDNYKRQDYQHGRALVENYVTTDWLKSSFGNNCPGCGDMLRFEIIHGKVESNMSADRCDSSERHHLNNIVPCCVPCNQRKSCW